MLRRSCPWPFEVFLRFALVRDGLVLAGSSGYRTALFCFRRVSEVTPRSQLSLWCVCGARGAIDSAARRTVVFCGSRVLTCVLLSVHVCRAAMMS
jgi:hypothetical protein